MIKLEVGMKLYHPSGRVRVITAIGETKLLFKGEGHFSGEQVMLKMGLENGTSRYTYVKPNSRLQELEDKAQEIALRAYEIEKELKKLRGGY